MTLRCVENKKSHCQIPIQQRGGLQGASGIAEVLAKETCYSSKNRAFLRNIYIKLQEYVRKFQAIDRSACNACGAWSSASGNAEVLAKETCDSSKNQAYLRNIYIKLQEYVRKFQAIDRSACSACGAWSSASVLSTRQKTIFIYVMIGGCIARTDVRIVRPASLRVASTNAI
jgi:hypothetical protein